MRALGVTIALLALAAGPVAAQMGFGGGASGPPKVPARREDLPYIRCQACELLAKHAYKQVREMKRGSTPSKKVDELEVIEAVEKMGVAWQPQGEWMAALDLQEEKGRLVLKEMGRPGECGEVCRTVELAAEEIIGEHDTDMAEALYTGRKTRAQFNNWLCYELTGVCKEKPPKAPKGRRPSPAFKPRGEGEPNMERMMEEMKAQGLKGSLYNREDMMKQMAAEGGDDAQDLLKEAAADAASAAAKDDL